MPRTYGTKAARLFKRPAKYARIDFGDLDTRRNLGQSYIDRPIHPIIADLHTLETYDGNRRIDGVMLIDPDAEVPCCLIDEPWDDSVKLEIQVDSAAHTRGLSHYEQYRAVSEWLRLNPDGTAKQFAGRVHLDEGVISKTLSLDRCIPAVQEAARAGRFASYSKWHQLSKLPPEEQAAALAEVLGGNGVTREELQRRRRGGRAASVKATSLPLVLAKGLTVTFKKDADGGLTIAAAFDALAELKRVLKEAIDGDYDPDRLKALLKTRAQEVLLKASGDAIPARAMKDMAEAGA